MDGPQVRLDLLEKSVNVFASSRNRCLLEKKRNARGRAIYNILFLFIRFTEKR